MSATAYALSSEIETGGTLDVSSEDSKPSQHPEPPRTNVPPEMAVILLRGSSELPESILLGTLFDSRFRVYEPIPVKLDRSEDGVSAIWEEIDEFGHAGSGSAASVELAKSLIELYSTLEGDQNYLGSDLARVWSVLQQHIRRARP
jgi:hypothetical protein